MKNINFSQRAARILIVEDEVLIADAIRFHLESKGYKVIGHAISYGEAVVMFKEQRPDLILLDVSLNGRESGIEFSRYLRRQKAMPPFIFLTSQSDDRFIEMAKETSPAGYLGKPIHPESLLTSIEIALFSFRINHYKRNNIYLKYQGRNSSIPLDSIEYLQAEHVYVRFVMSDGREVLQRGTLKEMMARLGDTRFVQAHRSFVINTDLITGYEFDGVYFGGTKIPVSRSRRNEVMAVLQEIVI